MFGPEIKNRLESIRCEVISQERPILPVSNTGGRYPIEKSVPTSILQTGNGFVGCFTSFQNRYLDLVESEKLFGLQKLKSVGRGEIRSITGCDVGTISLVGLELPYLLNKRLLRHDFIFGGAGDELLTLEISPKDLLEVNEIIDMFE